MNTQLLLNAMQRGVAMLVPKWSFAAGQYSIINRHLHIVTQNFVPKFTSIVGQQNNNIFQSSLLQPIQHNLTQVCGMKTKGLLKLRCKDCYFGCCKGRWYVRCRTHPRHKQLQIIKKERNTWILSSVCQSKKRPWW
ncbi:hypothetical protein PV325_008629 [Microctonus aethiopoides]|uniref:Large ribosomal subunit protein bL36m n=1 Tax=Microctonus aethiopoides TaxID=144406 RepID=A0AA39F195_9HYME|nr:hypothetical protein PV325_008629 [Microctonus aethiopoides]KAK0097187.1 hypothetical protein PV326_003001 [Microctonus aethiopoides]KAK0159223.1 hypothetical protein PV328_010132 [Microctonus aethiopoides]